MRAALFFFIFSIVSSIGSMAQTEIKGKVYDEINKEGLIGASVVIDGTTIGVTTDINGEFILTTDRELPLQLLISYISYRKKYVTVTSNNASNLRIAMQTDAVVMEAVEVKAQRISQKQQQAALTVESMDVLAIKEAASGNFYESLGALKEVDVTSASLGFKVINTRGFNSTSPVRSLQLIDGVDNQSPGLNFSLGNFLGASDLDVKNVEIVAGASSAFFGPGAFNGVVNMTTKDPFSFPGVSVEVKAGERSLFQRVVRLADFTTNKDGDPKFGYELNWFYMEADDWEADNLDPVEGSPFSADHPFGYDAVNVYGDEDVSFNNDNSDNLLPSQFNGRPGLTEWLRNGYKETDLVNYETDNTKLSVGLLYKIDPKITANYGFNYSTGNTIYQGDNRYALRGVEFYQHKLEIGEADKWFIRAYRTSEDAGRTYDAVTTALRIQEAQMDNGTWNTNFLTFWSQNIVPFLEDDSNPESTFQHFYDAGIVPYRPDTSVVDNLFFETLQQGFSDPDSSIAFYNDLMLDLIATEPDLFDSLYQANVDITNALSDEFTPAFFEPGTARFDSIFDVITSKTFTEGGSRFYDRSSLNHVQGEYRFNWQDIDFTVGANARWYNPDSRGTIFSDTLGYTYARDSLGNFILEDGQRVKLDSSRVEITNSEWGAYIGLEKRFIDEKLRASFTMRVDKNQNYDYLTSPAFSLVYTPSETSTFRASFSSAIRNPTLADQYLYYNVGRAILLGNVNGAFEEGVDSLITIDSFTNFRSNLDRDTLEFFNVESIRPEQVRTIELGYRGKLSESLFIDGGVYYSRYTDFIGFELGISADFDPQVINSPPTNVIAYRVSSNAKSIVTTQGASIGFNYYLKKMALSGNYSFNELTSGEDDPIIPAFNTPKHKFNLGISAREVVLFKKIPHFGYGINYKWIEGFLFEGSPQFTGSIPTYDMLDAQLNLYVPELKCTFKVGGSNIMGIRPLFAQNVENRWEQAFDNKNLQVYGGPRVGRLLYASILLELK
ncbi:MAG: TonB-dependent receptor [Flavobacteriales bacterium]|nr:TonB-dependent receptor [Flavobacteriales bacterium]